MVYEVITIIYISFIAKDIKMQYFRFITQENLLRYFPLEIPNRCVIIYMSYSYNCKFLSEIW